MALVRDNQPRIWDFSVLHRQLPWRVLQFMFPLFAEARMRAVWSVDSYPGRLLKRMYVYNACGYSARDRFNTCVSRRHALNPPDARRVRANRARASAIISNIYIIQSRVAASIRPNKQRRSINKLFGVHEKLLCRNRVMTRIRIERNDILGRDKI